MVDPTTTAAILASSLRLLESGLKLTIWDGWGTYPSRDRMEWLSKLVGMSADALAKAGEVFKHVAPEKARPEQAVQLWAIYVASFGEALAQHWGGSKEMAGRPGRWGKWLLPEKLRRRESEVKAATQFALDVLASGLKEPLPGNFWATPTASPHYRALWTAFTQYEVAEGAAPLLLFERDGDVQRFEGQFSAAFREALARAGNADLRALLTDSPPRGEALRLLVVTQMAAWRHHHVFASVDTTEEIPELPLELSYVEPSAKVRFGKKVTRGAVLAMLQNLLLEHKVIFVSADFGMGKSLTARSLAWRWANAYLDPQNPEPTIDRVFPIYVRCAGNMSLRDGLDAVLRRALKRSAEAAGVSVRPDDPALAPPPNDQCSVVLLDGLDEMVLSIEQTREFVREIENYATDKQRVLVFSRPEAFPRVAEPGFATIPHVVLEAFSHAQIDTWLSAWPRENAPTREQIVAHGFGKLASVPILLFMLALTWERYAASEGAAARVKIYEMFFDILAAGKYERGGETHPSIRRAAEQARDALVDCKELRHYQDEEEGRRRAVEAIRWLMDRVAWEALRREFSGEVLLSRHVSNILERELRVPETTLEEVRIGLLLGMQAQLSGGSQQFFFGHRSFLEFAVARYWERQLRRLCLSERRDDSSEKALWGAPLLEQESRVFTFLKEMLEAWKPDELTRLLAWARTAVADETMSWPRDERRVTFRSDPRILIRQAALAIGSHTALRLNEPFDLGGGEVLLLISTWWLAARRTACVLEAPGISLRDEAVLLGGLFSEQANFIKANLPNAYFCGAHLPGADFSEANLFRAEFNSAVLEGADFSEANLSGADLSSTDLESALLLDTNLHKADLSGSNLDDAEILGANLSHANLTDVMLHKANLSLANLEGADLSRASLVDAHLTGANLSTAKLEGANLCGADLSDAILFGANFENVRFDEHTRWPLGFEVPPLPIEKKEDNSAANSVDVADASDGYLKTDVD